MDDQEYQTTTSARGKSTHILHLTHTDILFDNRILKEMLALAELPDSQVVGVGLRQATGAKEASVPSQVQIVSLDLVSSKWRYIYSPIRHILVAIEMMIRLLLVGFNQRPDIVHCHDTPVLLVGLVLKLTIKARLIYDAHELESNKNGQPNWIARLTRGIERLSWPAIDHLISVSPSILEWYAKNLGLKPCSLILNSPVFKANEGDQKKSRYFHDTFGIPPTAKVFLYLGLLVPGRGIERMLEVFQSEIVSSHLVFVGYGALESRIAETARSSNKIHLHPPVRHEQVVDLSRSADIGLCIIENVSLSDYYCLPNKLFEYAFAGVPVLASDFPDIAKIVAEFGIGECCAVESEAIAEAVGRFENGSIRYVTSDLTVLGWDNQCIRLRQAYRNLIEAT